MPPHHSSSSPLSSTAAPEKFTSTSTSTLKKKQGRKLTSTSTSAAAAEQFPEYGRMRGGFPAWLSKKDRRLLQAAVNETRIDLVVAKDGSGNFTTVNEARRVFCLTPYPSLSHTQPVPSFSPSLLRRLHRPLRPLSDLSTSAAANNPLSSNLLRSISATCSATASISALCKLKIQNDIDSLSAKLDAHINDLGVIVKSGVLAENTDVS